MGQKKNQAFLTDSWRGAMAACLVIISAFVLLFTVAGFTSKSYSALLIVDGLYVFSLWGYALLFSGRSKSETLKRCMMVFSVTAATASVLLSWSYFTFQL